MAVPMSKFNWFDNSAIQTDQDVEVVDNRPIFFVVSSFDKGPEDLRDISGQDFYSLYGTPTFAKHGQNGIQTQRIINAGGRILAKRICAPDSLLANTVVCAKVTTTEEQKKDAEGHPIYLDEDGNETTEVTDTPVMITKTKVKWEASSFTGCADYATVKTRALAMLDETNGVYPLFIFCDNGRGVSSKAVRITPDYNTSRGMGEMFYDFNVYEGVTSIERQVVSFDPVVVYNNEAYGLDKGSCLQINAEVIADIYDKYLAKIADNLGLSEDDTRHCDLIYGYTYKGAAIENFSIDAESVDLNAAYGLAIKQGSNGGFGDAPITSAQWTQEMIKVFNGEDLDEVWDVDAHKIAFVCDANYPQAVKDAIANFVTWREDCVFFRDLGTGLDNFADIKFKERSQTIKNKFIADYSTSYTIKDPNTHKNIEVTMMYDFVACLINKYNTSVPAPCAGTFNGFTLDSAIEGTVNFTPIITPAFNQKEAFEDLRLNYAIFQEGQCVVQTCYTSQEPYTELSYVNNVLAIQDVIRALRTMCPKQRYRLVSGTDLSDYATECNNLLEEYTGNFYLLRFTYTEDKLKSMQKIFYASIEFAFNQWAQTEIFDIFALNAANLE